MVYSRNEFRFSRVDLVEGTWYSDVDMVGRKGTAWVGCLQEDH